MGTIVGRAGELAALREAVRLTSTGRSGVVTLEGEAGIGKTTLLDAVVEMALDAGLAVARGTALELESDRPFGPLVGAFGLELDSEDPHPRAVAELLFGRDDRASAGLDRTVPHDRYRIVERICDLVDHLTRDRPMALVIDDLHWADEPTLLTLRRLVHSAGSPVLLVLATRVPDPMGPVASLLDAAKASGASQLFLAPLPRPAVVSLLSALLGSPPGPGLLALADGAGGNPLFLAELVRVLEQEGNLSVESAHTDVRSDSGTADLARRLRSRAAKVSTRAAALVRVGAVLGSGFTLDEAARTGGWPVADLMDPLDELLRAGLLFDTGTQLTFRHDLLRRAIEDELSPTARRALHAAAGRALADGTTSSARAARHLALGAEPGDRDAVAWLHRAARETATKAPATTIALLDDALALVAPDDPVRVALLTDRVEALGWSGRNAEAEALARQLLDGLEDQPTRVALRRHLALALVVGNRSNDAVLECEQAAREAVDDPPVRALALAEGALSCLASTQLDKAEQLATDAIEVARSGGAGTAWGLALSIQSRTLAFRGDYERSLQVANEAMARAIDGDNDVARYQPGLFAIFTLSDLDRYDDMAVLIREERATADARGIVWAIPLHAACAATRNYFVGDLDDAYAEAITGLTMAEDSGALLPVVWLHALLAVIAIHRGDTEEAARQLGASEQASAHTTAMLGSDLLPYAYARLAELRGDLETASSAAIGAWNLFLMFQVIVGQRRIAVMALRMAMRMGQRDVAAGIATRLAEIADLTGIASDRGAARFARGLVDNDPDELVAAVDCYEPDVQPLQRAVVAEEAAKVLWAAGRSDEAAKALDLAHRTWLGARATGDAKRSGELFTALGLRRPHHSTRPTTGWDALTATEHRIADIIQTGATNSGIAEQLGVSRRTVETHLGHIYAKLGLRSRVELAVASAQRYG